MLMTNKKDPLTDTSGSSQVNTFNAFYFRLFLFEFGGHLNNVPSLFFIMPRPIHFILHLVELFRVYLIIVFYLADVSYIRWIPC